MDSNICENEKNDQDPPPIALTRVLCSYIIKNGTPTLPCVLCSYIIKNGAPSLIPYISQCVQVKSKKVFTYTFLSHLL